MGTEGADFECATNLIKQYIVMTDPTVSKTLINEELSEKMIALSIQLYREAKDLLNQNRTKLDIIIDELMENNHLSEEDITKLLSKQTINDE